MMFMILIKNIAGVIHFETTSVYTTGKKNSYNLVYYCLSGLLLALLSVLCDAWI